MEKLRLSEEVHFTRKSDGWYVEVYPESGSVIGRILPYPTFDDAVDALKTTFRIE